MADIIVLMSIVGVGIGYVALKKLIKELQWKKTLKNMIFKNRFKINKKNIKKYNLEEGDCCICLDNFHEKCENHRKCDKKGYQLHCNHIFHKKCILEWLNTKATCPLCNIDIDIKYPKNFEELQYQILHRRFEERHARNMERRRRIRNNRIHQSRNNLI